MPDPDETHLSPAGFAGGQGRSPEDAEAQAEACAGVFVLSVLGVLMIVAACVVAWLRGIP